ncbi:MAG: hypothetical protein ABL974_22530, partial [Prosthecobacter sp.]
SLCSARASDARHNSCRGLERVGIEVLRQRVHRIVNSQRGERATQGGGALVWRRLLRTQRRRL